MVNFFNKYLVLIIFGSVWIIGLLIHYVVGEKSLLWDIWSTIDVAFAVSLGIMAFLAYLEFIKAEEEITIYFEVEGMLHDTGLSLLRRDCTRSEINGILTMPLKEEHHFHKLKYMKNRELLQTLHAIQKGKEDRLVMPMSAVEFEQFEISL